VPLADISDPDLIPDAIQRALNLPRAPRLESAEQVVQALAPNRALLVLDNFEQLAETGVPVVWTLLERCPGLICLVTSRQRLDLAGEREVPVSALAVPSVPGTPERLVEFPSVSLFVDRAQMARPDFQITRDNAAAVAAVCQRLEGIPLAIELAASWAGVLTPSQMLSRLEERLTFLESRRKGGPGRQRSLRDTIEWSYRLLTPEQQCFFARLSVFRGGWSLEAAEAVCEEPLALAQLQGLQERSLLVAEESGSQIRFRLLEILREYAWERLLESGEAGAVCERHLAYYLVLAEGASSRIGGAEQAAALAQLETEHDNLREALRLSVTSRVAGGESASLLSVPKEAGLRLAVALTPFWEVRGYLTEGRKWLEMLLARSGEASDFWRAKTLEAAGTLAWQQGDYASARTFFEQSLTLFRSWGEKQGIAEALHGLGVVAERQADYATARALLEESIAIKRKLSDRSGLAASLNTLANVLADQSAYASARALYEESLLLRRELQDRRGIASSLNNLAIVALEQADYAEARTLLEESLAIRRALADMRGIAICLNNLGDLAWRGGEIATARPLYEEALTIRRQLGDKRGVASSLVHLANLAAIRDDLASAGSLYAESLSILRELEDKRGITGCLEEIAALAARQDRLEPAARLFGAAERLRETMAAPLPPVEQADYDRKIASLRSALPPDVFAVSWRAGRDMSLAEAVELALTK
jgi:predicted ATPase/Tfp pilus assembly protein PilF